MQHILVGRGGNNGFLDGTSLLPGLFAASEQSLGFYRPSAGILAFVGGQLDFYRNALAATSTDGVNIENTTAAVVTGGLTVQISPRIRQTGYGWDADDAVSRPVRFFTEVLPVSSTTVSGIWKLGYMDPITNALTYPFYAASDGTFTTLGSIVSGSSIRAGAASQLYWLNRSIFTSPSDGQANLTNAAASSGVGLDVMTDALLKVRTRAQTGYATIDALAYRVSGAAGIDASITTAGLVGKTITVSQGIITGFA